MSEIQSGSKDGVFGRGGGKFSEYANTLRIVFQRWTSIRQQLRDEKLYEEAEELILPSNEDWRQRVYYGLVESQRACDKEIATNRVGEAETTPETEKNKKAEEGVEKEVAQVEEGKRKTVEKSRYWEWEPRIHGSSLFNAEGESCKVADARGWASSRMELETGSGTRSRASVDRIAGSMTDARATKPGWRVSDIVLAAEVLRKDSTTSLVYSDEAEMRRVFGLVYDVLRYKKIFGRALEEVGFWRRNGALKHRRKIVWLLLYDMQGRKFSRRGEIDAVEERERMFRTAGLMDIEKALLEAKTHLAASVSRLRIRGSALSLDELLPARLRSMEGVAWGEQAEAVALASGWVNANKFASKQQFLREMSKLNLFLCEDAPELTDTGYAFDPICPKMIELPEGARETLARSALVRDHRFVFLERSLCLGAAALVRAMRVGRFCGPVVLTHALAPRHTGYLAELLQDVQDAGRLLAFGAGERRAEYETYLNELGVTSQRCRVFSEKYVSPPATAELDRATVVLAIPPCSYTGVRDIVDLAVARGGDMDLLESLTDARVASDDDPNDDDKRDIGQPPRTHLADQMSTLKYALTRPNVQFVIYEAHTVLPSETTEMIRRAVDYANRMAVARHVRDQPSKKKSSKEAGESRGESNVDKPEHLDDERSDDDRTFAASANVVVPDSDLFEVGNIDDIYGKNVSGALDPGCFLAVIKRKEMMQFDSLFMIKVAESKGLFGDPNERERRERKREPAPSDRDGPTGSSSVANPRKRTKRRFDKIELERLIAHTHCSLSRSSNENPVCPRQERLRAAYEKNNQRVEPSKSSSGAEKVAVSRDRCYRDEKNASMSTSARSELLLLKKKKYELYRLDSGPPAKATMSEDEAVYALKTMNYIRRMENKAAELYRMRLINGFLHLYSGQEAVAVGVKMSMNETDSLITAYRCHGFAVLFGVSARQIFAELMGRRTGVSEGKGGSMHMYAPQFYGGDGIVGGQVPIGAGLAFAHKYNGTGGVAWALYGDGAASQGQVHETYNMSKLWNLPVVFVCENNRYGMGTAVHRHSANTALYARGDLIPGFKVNGMNVVEVREAVKFARDHALRNGPIVVEMDTYRYYGHSMSDPGTSYRTRDETKQVQTELDPITVLGKLVVQNGLKTETEVEEIRQSTWKGVDKELEEAKADPPPEMTEIAKHVYVDTLVKTRGKVPWQTH